jgi:septal ring factor EnvC (AmiA/AmiB activator)
LQISSVIDEKNLLNETNQNLKKQLESLILGLEEKLKDHQKNEDSLKSEVETLKTEIADKSALQSRLQEIEAQLAKAESRLHEEVMIKY